MYKEVQLLKSEIEKAILEVKTLTNKKNSVLKLVKELDNKYQSGELKYFEYSKELNNVLKGRNKDDLVKEINNNIYLLLDKINSENMKIFSLIAAGLKTKTKIDSLAVDKEEPTKIVEKPNEEQITQKPKIIEESKTQPLEKPVKKPIKQFKIPKHLIKKAKKKMDFKTKEQHEPTLVGKKIPEESIHKPSAYGKIANLAVSPISDLIEKEFPGFKENTARELSFANIKSRPSYVKPICSLTAI